MLRFLVYGLTDPRTDEIRYIGKSSVGMRRPYDHEKSSYLKGQTYKERWIRSLLALGTSYGVALLAICESDEHAQREEIRWIAIGRSAGWRLTNLTDGGDGMAGFQWSDEMRAKIGAVMRGKPKSPEHRAKIADIRTGTKTPLEVRAKQSAAHKARAADPVEHQRLATLRKGAKNSEAARAKLRAANLGLVHSDERREKNRQARLGTKQSQETKDKRAASMRRNWAMVRGPALAARKSAHAS